jgi:hypothetical protein
MKKMNKIPQCSECRFSRLLGRCGNSATAVFKANERNYFSNICGTHSNLFEAESTQSLFSRIRLAIAFVLNRQELPTKEVKLIAEMLDYRS